MFSWCIRIYTVCKTSVLFCKTERVQNAPGYNNHYSWICVKVIMHQSRFVIVIITAYSTLQQQGNISFCLVIVECATLLRQTCQSQTMLKGIECTWQIFRHYVNTPIHMYWNFWQGMQHLRLRICSPAYPIPSEKKGSTQNRSTQ